MARQLGKGKYLHVVQPVRLIVGYVPPVHPGIDRYLHGAPGSRGVLQQVSRRPSTLIEDVFRRSLAQYDFHNLASTARLVTSRVRVFSLKLANPYFRLFGLWYPERQGDGYEWRTAVVQD